MNRRPDDEFPAVMRGPLARELLGVSSKTLLRWRRAGRVPYWDDPDTGTTWYLRDELIVVREMMRGAG